MKKLKKLIPIVLAAIISVCSLSSSASAAQNSDFEYTVEDGKATITAYTGSDTNVVVPSQIDGYDVKAVSFYAFMTDKAPKENLDKIKSVVVSEGIEDVGNWLFTNCTNIESITLPSTIKELATGWFFIGGQSLREFKFSGENARYYVRDGVLYDSQTNSLMCCPAQNKFENGEYTIVSGTTTIYSWAFDYCQNLEKLVMPNSVTAIGDHAFSGCPKLSEIVLSENINAMGSGCFASLTSLKEITIPKNVTGIYDSYSGVANAYFGTNYTEKISGFTVKGYRGTEAEKYANEYGFKFVALDDAEPTTTQPKTVDYTSCDPSEFLGLTLDEITAKFGSDYTDVSEREAGQTKFFYYPNTGNPFEFGIDYETQKIKYVYIYYNLCQTPITLFDGATNLSLKSELEALNGSYNREIMSNLQVGEAKQIVKFNFNNGTVVQYEWIGNNIESQPADRVLIEGDKKIENLSETVTEPVTKADKGKASSTALPASSNVSATSSPDTSTADSTNNTAQNSAVQTGVVSLVVVLCALAAAGSGAFLIWYKRSGIGK